MSIWNSDSAERSSYAFHVCFLFATAKHCLPRRALVLQLFTLIFWRKSWGNVLKRGEKKNDLGFVCFFYFSVDLFQWQSGQHDAVDTVEHKDTAKFSCHWLCMTRSWDNLGSTLAGVQMVLQVEDGGLGLGVGRGEGKMGTSRLQGWGCSSWSKPDWMCKVAEKNGKVMGRSRPLGWKSGSFV